MGTLRDDARELNNCSRERLKKYWEDFCKNGPSVEMAWSGKNKGHETIQQRWMKWRKGTRVHDIEIWLAVNIEKRK